MSETRSGEALPEPIKDALAERRSVDEAQIERLKAGLASVDEINLQAKRCDCWRLGDILDGYDELPKRVCPEGLILSRQGWFNAFFANSSLLFVDLIREGSQPANQRTEIPLGDGRWIRRESETDFRVRPTDRRVLGVIRQWVEEEAPPALQEILEKKLPDLARQLASSLQDPEERFRYFNESLAGYGLPMTPSTKAWIGNKLRPEPTKYDKCVSVPAVGSLPKWLPFRLTCGALVVSVAISPGTNHASTEVFHQMNFSSPWSTPSVKTRAIDLAEAHSQWFEQRLDFALPFKNWRVGNKRGPRQGYQRTRQAVNDYLARRITLSEVHNIAVEERTDLKGDELTLAERKTAAAHIRRLISNKRA